jgi:hypothetical protein
MTDFSDGGEVGHPIDYLLVQAAIRRSHDPIEAFENRKTELKAIELNASLLEKVYKAHNAARAMGEVGPQLPHNNVVDISARLAGRLSLQ